MRFVTPFAAAAVALTAGTSGAQPCSPAEVAKLLASDGEAVDFLGRSVAISGDFIVLGAHADDDNGTEAGSAYIYRLNGTNWAQEAKLLPADGTLEDSFGGSVSISGNLAVIGAAGDNVSGLSSGSAYVFGFNGADWVEEIKLLPHDGLSGSKFGGSVSVSGDTAVIGAFGDNDNGLTSGSAYVFRFDGTNWLEETKLLPTDGAAGDGFGRSVSVSGDTVVIGASGDDDSGANSGSAYVFRFDGANWGQEAKLLPSDGSANDDFGGSVSVSGDAAVIGAFQDDDNGTNSGSAYVFRFDGTNWVEEAKFLPDDVSTHDEFGGSVSVSGDITVVGTHWDDDNGANSGSAYVFRFDGASWTEEAKLLPDDGATRDEFGRSVSVSGHSAVIGSPRDSDNGNWSGSAYAFDLNCMTPCLPDTNHDGQLTPTDFTAWINAFNNNLPECDQNGDVACTPTDFTAWINNFNAGC